MDRWTHRGPGHPGVPHIRSGSPLLAGIRSMLALVIVAVLTACPSSKTAATHPGNTSKGPATPPASTTKTVTVTVPASSNTTIACVDETTGHTDFVAAPTNSHMETTQEGLGQTALARILARAES
jgi:hypothetical protein